MATHVIQLDERRQKRLSSKHPVDYEIGGTILKGIIVNASSNSIMVRSSVSLATVLDVLSFLDREPSYRTVVEFIFEGVAYVAEAEIKHFHLDSSGGGRYTFRVGFGFPKGKLRVPEIAKVLSKRELSPDYGIGETS